MNLASMQFTRYQQIQVGLVLCALFFPGGKGWDLMSQTRRIDSLLHRADALHYTDTREDAIIMAMSPLRNKIGSREHETSEMGCFGPCV